MRLERRNGKSMEDVVTRASHFRLRFRFASSILSCNLLTLLSAPYGYPAEGFYEFFLSRKGNARKFIVLSEVSLHSIIILIIFPSATDRQDRRETDVTDQGQIDYQAGNPWLRPQTLGSCRRLYRAE